MNETTKVTREEALRDMESNTHDILPADDALAICAALGVPPIHMQRYDDAPGEFKAPIIEGGGGINGSDMRAIAEYACRFLNVSYPHKYGRGSQVRACVDALRQHFSVQVTR